jgi:denticleless
LSTGGRDGAVCLWDLRVSERRDSELADNVLRPVMTISKAHEERKEKPKGRKGKSAPLPRTITALIYPGDPYQLITSGSFDGYVPLNFIRAPKSC